MDGITPLKITRQEAEDGGAFVVVAEYANQGPLILEAEGQASSYEAAMQQCEKLAKSPRILRVCVARLQFENGNALLMQDLERMQK